MKSYWIDEISASDMKKIDEELKQTSTLSGLEKLYWIGIPDDLLSATQASHKGCGPHVFALEMGPSWIRLEFFVRSLSQIRCSCNAYSTPPQVVFTMNFADRLLERLSVRT